MGLWGNLNLLIAILAVITYFTKDETLILICIGYTCLAGLLTFIAEVR